MLSADEHLHYNIYTRRLHTARKPCKLPREIPEYTVQQSFINSSTNQAQTQCDVKMQELTTTDHLQFSTFSEFLYRFKQIK